MYNGNQQNGPWGQLTLAQVQQEKDIEVNAEWAKRDIQVRAEEAKAGIAIQKGQMLEDVKAVTKLKLSKDLADVSSKKELQRTNVTFSSDHDVFVQKECFGEDIKGKLPIKVLRTILFCHESDTARKVLYILVKKDSGDEAVLYWDIERNEERWIRKVFESNGVYFGFGEKKESEIRRKVLLAALNMAESMVLSERHGWYQLDGEWQYAFPEELTWKEVDQRC